MSLSLSDTLLYYVLLFIVRVVSHLPFGVLYALSDIIYIPFYHVVRYRRRVVRKNLTESFPNKSVNEIIQLEKRFYHFFIDMCLESFKLMSISGDEIRRRMKFVNPEILHKLLAEGKSVSVYLGHYGNWEWISSAGLWFQETTIVQVYRKLNNRAVGKIMGQLRCRMGHVYVDMHNTVRFMANAARENKPYVYGLLADQSPKKRDAKEFVLFLNHSAPVITGTEKATKRYCHAALFIDMKRVGRGYYEGELVPLHNAPQSLPDYELTHLYFQHLEAEILRQPELYLWSHNRFKYAKEVQQ
ncbi:MAG: lysophospholipid acyltransferase family protein [Porphyromonadaceae bacterium]|nr:lysophospholipid acyltransferase family protein [Porphyromonadaceae bacterium]